VLVVLKSMVQNSFQGAVCARGGVCGGVSAFSGSNSISKVPRMVAVVLSVA